jgi:hypothetical protein
MQVYYAVYLASGIDTSTSARLKNFIQIQMHVWGDSTDRLVPEIWSFDTFMREKLWRWVGWGSSDNSD